MNAVIVELRGKKAAALLEDGTVVVVANSNYEVGQRIRYAAKSRTPGDAMRTARKVSVWAAGIAAALCIGVGVYAYQSPYSYVSVDVNPSIQFTLNRYDQVLKVTAINSDAQPIVKTLGSQGVTHKSIRNAVEITIDNLASEHYFDDGGYLLIAAASKNTVKAEKLTHMLTQTALETGPETLTVKALIGELAQAQIADEKGISLGRQELLEQLMCGANPAQPFSYDEWRNKSVEELIRSAEQSATQFGDERPAFSGSANTQAPQQYSEETGKNQPLTQPEATEAPSQSGGSSGLQPRESASSAPAPTPTPPVTATPQATDEGVSEGSHGETPNGKSPKAGGSQG